MIAPQELRRTAREKGLALDLVEKDFVLGWLLFGVASSSLSKKLAFKGGTALSKVYFPGEWRLSEDLDFTVLVETSFDEIAGSLEAELPEIVRKGSEIPVRLRDAPFTNPNYLQSRFQYTGPVSPNTVKIEVSREQFVGEVSWKSVPKAFDYPTFKVGVYSLENILAEKLRALIERGKVKDYYDVWKLLKTVKFDGREVKRIFLKKCEGRGIPYTGVNRFFPKGTASTLRPHLKAGLARLSPEPLPDIETFLEETKDSLSGLFG